MQGARSLGVTACSPPPPGSRAPAGAPTDPCHPATAACRDTPPSANLAYTTFSLPDSTHTRTRPGTPLYLSLPLPLLHLFFFFNLIFLFLKYSRFSLVIYFIHISVYMSVRISQFIPPPRSLLSLLGVNTFVLYICVYFCLANQFICTIFLDSTYRR